MVNAGRVAIVPQGEWSADATYKRLDAVTNNNTLYFAKKEVPAGTATSNTEYWSKSIIGGAGAIATIEAAGIVKPDGTTITIDDDGTIHGQSEITVDGTTITLDEAKGIISLAKTLQDKIKTIDNKLPKTSVVNTNTTTEAGFALDARQANPNIEGTLAANILQLNNDLNGSNKLNLLTIADCIDGNYANVFRISNKLYLIQGYIHLKETAKQNELLIKTNQLHGYSSLILTSNISGMSFPLLYSDIHGGMVSPNINIPGNQYYYIQGFLMDFNRELI